MRMSGCRTTTSSPGHDVVDDVAVDGRPHLVGAALEVAQELQQAAGVVALGEALALHQPALGEHGVGVQEPVRGDEVDLRVVGPAGQQRLQDAGERALADGHAAGDADHVRHPRRHRAEERRRHPGQVLGRADVQVEQARQRQVDRRHLVEVDALVDAPQLGQVVLAQRQRGRRAQRRPVVAPEREEPAPGLDHTGDPTLAPCPCCNPLRSRPQAARRLPDAALARRHASSPTPCRTVSPGAAVAVLDPACGDGRFLVAAARRLLAAGGRARRSSAWTSTPTSVTAARRALAALGDRRRRGASSTATPSPRHWGGAQVDVVVGNPPYLSQLAAATTRGGASRHGGGPYADAAAEFLALAGRLVRPGRRTDRARAAAVDPRLARRRRRARRARPAGDDRVVVVVAAAGVRRPGARVRAGLRRPPGARRRPGARLVEPTSSPARSACRRSRRLQAAGHARRRAPG